METNTISQLPCLMQSAFKFKNGVNALFGTSESTGLSIFKCDENFQPLDKYKPESRTARQHMTQWDNMLEYHKWLRGQHPAEELVIEHSTDLTGYENI